MCFYRPAKSNPNPSTDKHTSTNAPHQRLAHSMIACSLEPGGTSCTANAASGFGCRQCTVSAASPSSLHLTTRVNSFSFLNTVQGFYSWVATGESWHGFRGGKEDGRVPTKTVPMVKCTTDCDGDSSGTKMPAEISIMTFFSTWCPIKRSHIRMTLRVWEVFYRKINNRKRLETNSSFKISKVCT